MTILQQVVPPPGPPRAGIAPDEIHERQRRAIARAAVTGYDALLVVGRSFYDRPGDVAYLTNHFPPFPTTVFSDVNRGMGHAFFLLSLDGHHVLLTDPRGHRRDLVPVDDVRSAADLGAAVVDLLRERRLDRARVGLVGDDILPAALDRSIRAALPGLRLDPEPGIVADLRAIKSPAELLLLRHAARCADAGLQAAIQTIQSGDATERDVCAAGIAAAIRAGADFVRYLRVHSGPWSAAGSRWPQAMDRRIEPGDVVALDIIGAYEGYQFDVNRTTVFGRPDRQRLDLLETVHEATAAAVAACVAGATVGDVAAAAAVILDASPFAASIGSLMGHGIGLETVELPYVQRDGGAELRPGMVLCIEPGVFVRDLAGASIEQEVIIAAQGGPEVITPTPARLW